MAHEKDRFSTHRSKSVENGNRPKVKKHQKSQNSKNMGKKKEFRAAEGMNVPQKPWMATANQMGLTQLGGSTGNNMVPMLLPPGMMMPLQFPPMMMQLPFPQAEEGSQMNTFKKAFEKAMMSAPLGQFPGKVLPSEIFTAQQKQMPNNKKEKPVIDRPKADEFDQQGYPLDPATRELHMNLEHELYEELRKSESREPHLLRLIRLPGLLNPNYLLPTTKAKIQKMVEAIAEKHTLSTEQRELIKTFTANPKKGDKNTDTYAYNQIKQAQLQYQSLLKIIQKGAIMTE